MKQRHMKWREGTVWDHLAAAADMLGFENADIALGLAYVPWESAAERDQFLEALVAPRARELAEEVTPNG
jgi:hypothetical protein